MSTGHDISEPADATVVAPPPTPRIDTSTAHRDSEPVLRDWEGLPADANILFPAYATPMRMPERSVGLLVQAVDINQNDDDEDELELFAGSWMPEHSPADLLDGDLAVRITPRDDTAVAADVEMLLAHDGCWRRVGAWLHLDSTWPAIVSATAAVVMGLSTDIVELCARHDAGPSTSLVGSSRGAVSALLDAGLVKPGEEFLWERRNNRVRHTARVRTDGAVVLADGRVFATPSGAAGALCGYCQNGWGVFRRVSDGRALAELRTELWMGRGQ
jgi:hypothetical protein